MLLTWVMLYPILFLANFIIFVSIDVLLVYIYIYAARHGMDSNLWMLGVKIGKEDINSQDWKREI